MPDRLDPRGILERLVAFPTVSRDSNLDLVDWVNNNFVDELAAAKFQELGIEPSPLCDDATFLRRAYLDAIGVLPTADEARRFVADNQPDKRERLIDELLDRSREVLVVWPPELEGPPPPPTTTATPRTPCDRPPSWWPARPRRSG